MKVETQAKSKLKKNKILSTQAGMQIFGGAIAGKGEGPKVADKSTVPQPPIVDQSELEVLP